MAAALDIDQFRLIVAVAEAGNFTRAAAMLARTQSAVSMQAKRCEDLAGAVLFVREPRRVRLTATGERLAAHARRILAIEAEARAEYSAASPVAVRIGVPDDYAHFLPPVLAAFSAAHPHATVQLVCAPSATLTADLEADRIDLAILSRAPSQRLAVLRLEPLVWVRARQFAIPRDGPLPLAIYQPGCMGRDHALRALAARGRAFRIAYESPSIMGLLTALRARLAVAAIARTSVPPDLQILRDGGELPKLPALEMGLGRSAHATGPAVDSLAAIIRKALAQPMRDARGRVSRPSV